MRAALEGDKGAAAAMRAGGQPADQGDPTFRTVCQPEKTARILEARRDGPGAAETRRPSGGQPSGGSLSGRQMSVVTIRRGGTGAVRRPWPTQGHNASAAVLAPRASRMTQDTAYTYGYGPRGRGSGAAQVPRRIITLGVIIVLGVVGGNLARATRTSRSRQPFPSGTRRRRPGTRKHRAGSRSSFELRDGSAAAEAPLRVTRDGNRRGKGGNQSPVAGPASGSSGRLRGQALTGSRGIGGRNNDAW